MKAVLLALALQEGIDWKSDYAAAAAEARRDGKLLVVHFTIEGRPACASMDQETLRHPDVVRASRDKFVNVRVDVDKRPDFYQGTIGGRGGLATAILDGTGDVVSLQLGFAAADAYVRFLENAERGYPGLRAARDAASGNDPAALAALAEAYLALDSRRRAEECYEKVLAGEKAPAPAKVLAHERLARLAVLRGRNLEARAHVADARKIDPESAVARADRLALTEALALSLERKHVEAARLLDETLRKFPRCDEADFAKFTLGFVLHQIPEDKRALEVLEGLVREHPSSPWLKPAREQIEHIKNPQPDHTH